MNEREEILDLLRENARLSIEDISAMTKKTEDEVKQIIRSLENDGVILKYAAIVNPEKDAAAKDKVRAEIEIQVMPEREHGFDSIAERIYRFPQVKSMYLMSGKAEFLLQVNGKTMREISNFVAHTLAPTEGINGTETMFILKEYKKNGVILEENTEDGERLLVTP